MGTSLYEQFQREQSPQQPTSLYDQYRREQSAQPSEKPGLLSRVGEGITSALAHPIDTAMNAVVAPIESAFKAAVSPGVGESRPDARLSKGGNSSGRAIDTSPYDAQHGGVTNKERTAAGIQSVVNAAAPTVFGPLAGKIGNMGALATTGAAEGAAYNPDDPAAGALTGALVAPTLGAVTKGAVRGSEKVADVTSKVRRIRNATPVGEQVQVMNKTTEAADRANYGAAENEAAAAGGSSPALTEALDHPRVKPFVDMVRESERGNGADDAAIAREAYKLMSRQRRGLQKKLAVEYDAKADLDADNLAVGMRQLKAATAAPGTADISAPSASTVETPAVMPSFPGAVAEHARMKGERGAFNNGVLQTRRAMRGSKIAPEKLDTQGKEAFLGQILGYDPAQAQKALEGALGAAKEEAPLSLSSLSPTLKTGFGLGRDVTRARRAAPLIDALDRQAGNPVHTPVDLDEILKYFGLTAAQAPPQ